MDSINVSLPITRPALLTSAAELDAIRQRLQEPGYAQLYEEVIKLAQSDPAEVTSPHAAAADVDPRLFNVGWRLLGMESVLPAAGVAWRLTRDKDYVKHAIELLNTALDWNQWSDGRHAVVDGYYNAALETASGMRAFAWALDLFAGALPEGVELACRKKLAYFTQRLTEISREGATRWSANPFDDWSADLHSAIGHAALALYGIDDRAADWLELAHDRVIAYLDCLPADGGHPSGIFRWEFALTHCCTFLEALYRVTGTDLRRHPAIERTRRFAVRCLAPGGRDIVQIDQGLPLSVSNVTRGPLSKLLAKWFQDPVLGWALFNTCEQSYIEATDLLWYDDSVAQRHPGEAAEPGESGEPGEPGESSAGFPDTGWVVMRSGWSDRDNMVAFQCTPYWPGYHHLDQGTFEIFVHGHETILDCGLGWRAHPNYFDRYRDSMAHNVVLVNGQGQLKHTAESHGEMKLISLSEDADYAVGECAGAYEGVEQFTRAMLFLKPDVLVIRDIIRLPRPGGVEWLLHGDGQYEICVRAEDKGFSLTNAKTAIHGFIIEPDRWRHTLQRGYKLEDWHSRHEVTHPVLALLPPKADSADIVIVTKMGEAGLPREFPGRVADDGALLLRAGSNEWRVGPSEDGLFCEVCTGSETV